MKFRNLFFLFLLLGAVMSAATLTIPGTANIFGAGHAVAPDPAGGGGGTLPPGFTLPAGTGRVLTFSSVTGEVSCCSGGSTFNGPDGGPFASGTTDVLSNGGIAGIKDNDRTMFLVGVFLTGAEPSDPAPTRLDFTGAENSAGITALIAQTFFIGDGRTGTGSGAIQQFFVPDGATRLFLGFADSFDFGNPTLPPGYYGDNVGSLEATFDITGANAVPEPATFALLGLGLAAVMGLRRASK